MKNLSYLSSVIDHLVQDGLLLPAFILKCQIVEYDLKRFIWNYCRVTGNRPKTGLTLEFLEKATLGGLYGKLKEIEDTALNIEGFRAKVKVFKDIRNEFVHDIISSGREMEEIEKMCAGYLEVADTLLENTWWMLDWVENYS